MQSSKQGVSGIYCRTREMESDYLKYHLLDLLRGKRSFKMKVNVQHNSLRRAIESSTGVCSWGQTVGSFLSRTG